jgi:hypothetical protein
MGRRARKYQPGETLGQNREARQAAANAPAISQPRDNQGNSGGRPRPFNAVLYGRARGEVTEADGCDLPQMHGIGKLMV